MINRKFFSFLAPLVLISALGCGGSGSAPTPTPPAPPVLPAPVASFTSTAGDNYPGTVVNFTDTSTGKPTSWLWEFGDAKHSTSTLQNPSFVFQTEGFYNVTLTSTNTQGTSRVSNVVQIIPFPVLINFTMKPAEPMVGEMVTFTNTSTGTRDAKWYISDEPGFAVRSGDSFQYAFTKAGAHNVQLVLVNASSGVAVSTTKVILVTPQPVASFTMNNPKPLLGETVQFTDTSSGSPVAWKWNFADGDTSTLQHPTHRFMNTGVRYVVLDVTYSNGVTISKNAMIQVLPTPYINFSIFTLEPYPEKPVQFTDTSGTSTYTVTGYSWDFGDKTTSTQQNPIHTYTAAGDYTITFTRKYGEATSTISQVYKIYPATGPSAYSQTVLNVVGIGNVSAFNSTPMMGWLMDSIPTTAFKAVNKVTLLGTDANLIKANYNFRKGTENTVNIFYIATHGNVSGLTINSGPTVTWNEITTTVSTGVKGPVLFIINACDAGMIKDFLPPNTCALTQCISDQLTSTYYNIDKVTGEYIPDPHGFDAQIYNAFKNRLDPNHDGVLTFGELYDYVYAQMRDIINTYGTANGYLLPGGYGDRNTVVLAY